jgi:hypothetical protein
MRNDEFMQDIMGYAGMFRVFNFDDLIVAEVRYPKQEMK